MRRDIDFNLVPHPLTGDLATKKDSSAIKQSLKNIVLTSFYERGFNVIFGTNLRQSLFENITPLDIQTMKDLIEEGITNHEPDVELIDVHVQRGDTEHDIIATVIYTEFSDPSEQNLSVNLSRLR